MSHFEKDVKKYLDTPGAWCILWSWKDGALSQKQVAFEFRQALDKLKRACVREGAGTIRLGFNGWNHEAYEAENTIKRLYEKALGKRKNKRKPKFEEDD